LILVKFSEDRRSLGASGRVRRAADTHPVAGWTDLLISSPVLGKALAQTLGKDSVAQMHRHADIVVASTVRKVVYRAIYTEAKAKLLLHARMLAGPVTYLAPEEAAVMEKEQAPKEPARPCLSLCSVRASPSVSGISMRMSLP
jgi:ribulose-5-phosphate 4-epimerase/fuculose-1-phosphate aldolase